MHGCTFARTLPKLREYVARLPSMKLRGQHYFGWNTGWVCHGGIFWFRVLGFGAYRIRGERPYLLVPGRPPKRNVDLIARATRNA